MAISKYNIIAITVKLFNVRSAELGDPSILLFVAKLANPLFCGARKNIILIKKILNNIQIIFNIKFFEKE
jgi:hypothetical protein